MLLFLCNVLLPFLNLFTLQRAVSSCTEFSLFLSIIVKVHKTLCCIKTPYDLVEIVLRYVWTDLKKSTKVFSCVRLCTQRTFHDVLLSLVGLQEYNNCVSECFNLHCVKGIAVTLSTSTSIDLIFIVILYVWCGTLIKNVLNWIIIC